MTVTLGMSFSKPEDQGLDGHDADERRRAGSHAGVREEEDISAGDMRRAASDVLQGVMQIAIEDRPMTLMMQTLS